ncbi:MAG: hypothetical protein HOY76_26055 [Streptomyces sp.]|nr:hypothetical protein [Streptomyces sp.]NUS90048.1 hypothetical protein [Streptomyces sp.]
MVFIEVPAQSVHRRVEENSVCTDFKTKLVEFNGEANHVHLLVNFPPKAPLSKPVNSLKRVSSRRLRQTDERVGGRGGHIRAGHQAQQTEQPVLGGGQHGVRQVEGTLHRQALLPRDVQRDAVRRSHP